MIGRLPGTPPGRPKRSQNLPGELPRSPRPLRGPSRTPRPSWEHVQASQLSRQSVPGQLIDHLIGFGDRPTSPGVGLGGVTCSGFGSAASADDLSHTHTHTHKAYGPLVADGYTADLNRQELSTRLRDLKTHTYAHRFVCSEDELDEPERNA